MLAEDVEDEDHNTTRFVVLSRELVEAPAGNGPVVTSFIFNVRNLPAALYKALGGFATNGVNMTKLESYMVGGEFTATQFLAEVDGHPSDVGVARALEELQLLHHRREDPRRLPRRPVPRGPRLVPRVPRSHKIHRVPGETRRLPAEGSAGELQLHRVPGESHSSGGFCSSPSSAPCGSRSIAVRPTPGTSYAGTSSVAPSSTARASEASQSSTLK